MARNDPFADLAPPNKKKNDPFADLAPPPRVGFPAKTLSPLKIGAPSFQQFAEAGAELPAAPVKKKYDTAFAEDIFKRQAKAQPTQPQTSYATSDMIGRLARTAKAEANRPVEEFKQQALDVLKAPLYVARQAVPAVSGMAAPFVEGAYNLLGRPDIAEFTRKTQQDIEQSFAPQSAGETVIGAPLRLAGAFAPFMAAGATAAPITASAGLSGLQSQAKGGSFVEFLGDKLDSDVLKRIAASKYKTPADMVLDATLGLAFGSLDNTVNAFKNKASARAALRAQGAEPFVQMGSLIREGVQSGALDVATATPYLKAADKFAQQAKVRASLPLSGAGARAVDVVAGLGSSAQQFGRNVASNVGTEAKLFSDAGSKLAEQAALSGAQVPIPKKPTQGRLDREEFSSRLGRALDAGNDAEVARLLKRQDEVLSEFAPEAPTQVPLRPAFSGQTSVLNRPFAPSLVTKAVRKESPSVAGAEWAARQRELGERGVPEVRSNVTEYGQASQPMPRATAVDKEFQKKVADWYDKAQSTPDDKEVQQAYRAFAEETAKQYEYLTNKGMTFEFVDNPSSYKNSGEMMKDIAENKHLFVFKTGDDFDHPLLSAEENDQFRAVHDYFGHAAYGHQFGELGEENAFRVHAATFSPEARRAMATETRGQNSWVNTRPENLAAPGTVYADQKVVLLPKQFMNKYPAEKPLGALANRAVTLANMGGKEAGAVAAGAALGASADEENRLRGAGIGALGVLGAVSGGALRPSTRLVDDAVGASKSAADALQQPRAVGGVGGVVEDVVAPVTPTAPVAEPVVEAVAEPVKAPLPPAERSENPLFLRSRNFGDGDNSYVVNANNIEEGWTVFKDTASGALKGQWIVIPPAGGHLYPLGVYTKKEAEAAVLEFVNQARSNDYALDLKSGRRVPYQELVSPREGFTLPISSAIAGKAFDIGGALGEGVKALSNAPGGKAQIAKVGLGAVGYGLSQAEDERLQGHGNALMGLAAYSLVHGKVKQGAKAAGAAVAEELAKSPTGRKVLDEVSLDIRVDPRVKETVGVAMREMAKYRAIGRELASEAKARGGVFDRTVSDLVEKEAVEADVLSPEDMKIAVALAQKIADNSLGLKKVEARLMSADTYAKRGTAYLPRRYAKYEAKDVNDVVVQHKGKTFRISGEKIRNDALTSEERDALGEIREASYRIADYFGRGSKDIATAHLFEALAEIPGVIHPEYVSAVREAAIAADLSKVARTPTKAYRGSPTAGKDALRAADVAKARAKGLSEQFKRQGQEYVTLPDTPQLGVLRGAVVRKDAAAYLNDLPDFQSTNRMYNRLMHYWKSAHTVFNVPATHLTNMASNVFMGILGGLPIQEQVVAIPRALKDIQEYGPTTRFLTEAGVIERALPTYGDTPLKGLARDETVLRSLMKTTRPETREALEAQGLKGMSWMEEKARKVGGKVEQAYSLGDTMFRVALFDKLAKQGMSNEDALKEVMRVFPGYDTRSPILQKLKHVSPFVMYPAKYLPAALNLIAEHPWRWALASASWAAIDQASRRQAGAVREEDLPPNRRFGKGGYLVPGPIQAEALGLKSKEAGKRLMFDMARYTPFTALTGSPAPGTTVSAISEKLPGIVQPSGPLADIIARGVLNVDPFSGKPFIKKSDDAMDKLKKFTVGTTEAGRFSPGLAASLLLPSSLSYHLPNIAKDVYYGNEEAAKMSAAGLLGGRPVAVKRGQQASLENYKLQQQIREVNTELQGDLRAARDMVVRRNLIKKAMEKRQRLVQESRKSRQP
jgi:hypothetical protein